MASLIRSVTPKENSLNDIFWLRRALGLAEKGRGRVEPNPLVGAVLLDKRGRFAAEGYHRHFGGPHAEVEVIRKAGRRAEGGTLYVTLEPCSTHGKTPPCTDLIHQSRIRRLVFGAVDPNPKHRGRGIRKLRTMGVRVAGPLLSGEVERQNAVFFKWMKNKLPYVALKMAESLDGKIATVKGESKWITSKESRTVVQRLRTAYQAILVGTSTLRQDRPSLALKGISGRNPRRIFVVRDPETLRSYLRSQEREGDLLFCRKEPRFSLRSLQIIRAPFTKKGVQIAFVLKRLAAEGISSLLIEGGGEMAASFLEGGWVDRVYFFIAPVLIGGRTAKTSVEGKGIARLCHALSLKNIKVSLLSRDLLVEGEL